MPPPDEPAMSALPKVQALAGTRIERVVYREIRYEDEPHGAFRIADHHSLDYGVELHLESRSPFSLIWAR